MINNNIEEDFCSFEVSKLLKEKGFDRVTSFKKNVQDTRNSSTEYLTYWQDSTNPPEDYDVPKEKQVIESKRTSTNSSEFFGIFQDYTGVPSWIKYYEAPTHSIAIKWIRENFGVYINYYYLTTDKFGFEIKMNIRGHIHGFSQYSFKEMIIGYKTSQEATEAALKYFLTELITEL